MTPTVISPRTGRTLYNVADVLIPAREGAPGGGDVDLVPELERRLRWGGAAQARRFWLVLACIEWWPILTLRARRPFSKLPLSRRRRLLAAWEGSRLGPRRRALAWLRELIGQSFAAVQSEPGA